jgi:hypothetical protein
MALRENFKAQAGAISDALRAMTGTRGAWTDDLEAALSVADFNEAQMAAIRAAATPTCLQDLGDGQGGVVDHTLAQKLTHAFKDPVQNSALFMHLFANGFYGESEREVLTMMTQARGAIRDIIHNYPLMLREDMPGSIRQILDCYEQEVLPQLDTMIAELAAETGADPAAIPPGVDWQHLYRLEPGAFA